MINSRFIKYLSAFIFFTISIFAQDTTDQEEREKILKEYQEISSRLMDLQKQALSDLEIAKQAEDFSQNLEKAMVDQDSSILPKINRREEIVDQFENADKNGNKTEVLNLQQEYQKITQELMVHQQKVLENDNELKEEGEALEDSLFEKMKEIDPEVTKLVSRLETLNAQIRGLDTDQQL
jgi:hypothetical protein